MILAGYHGRCPNCDEHVVPGDPLGRVDDDWCCEECVSDAGGEDNDRAADVNGRLA